MAPLRLSPVTAVSLSSWAALVPRSELEARLVDRLVEARVDLTAAVRQARVASVV